MMQKRQTYRKPLLFVLSISLLSLSSCLTSEKVDKFVAEQYNNELPVVKKQSSIAISSAVPSLNGKISSTNMKTEKFLPLLFYWYSKERVAIQLNPQIAITNFTNALSGSTLNPLYKKLNGQQLNLEIEKVPTQISMVSVSQTFWVVYAFSTLKVWMEPEYSDLVVNYTFYPAEGGVKTGKVLVKNPLQKQNFGMFQSWRSGISGYITEYNEAAKAFSKAFVREMVKELDKPQSNAKP